MSGFVENNNILTEPWRTHSEDAPWGREVNLKCVMIKKSFSQTFGLLKKEIASYDVLKEAGVNHINVLLTGEIGAGKSSFFNSVESVFKDHVTSRANAGSVGKSLTTQYRQYFVDANDGCKNPIKLRFCDSMGLEGGEDGLNSTDVSKIMDGHVSDMAKLSHKKLVPGSPGYNENPTDEDRIHCVALVMNALTVSTMDKEVENKFKKIRAEADARNLYPLVILTRIDELCEDTEKDITNVFSSILIRNKVREVCEKFGINENRIHPVRNYSSQTECEEAMDILTLRGLRQLVRNSKAFLKDTVERKKSGEKQRQREEAALKQRKKVLVAPFSDLVSKAEVKTGLEPKVLVSGLVAILALWLAMGFAAQLVSAVIGYIYPAYQTVRAMSAQHQDDKQRWLQYWVVFSFTNVLEFFSDQIVWLVPMYWLAKTLLLIWCMMPSPYSGSELLHARVIRPAFLRLTYNNV